MVDPDGLARLHAAAFASERPWSEAEFRDLLASPHVFAVLRADGFALGRAVAGEAELLTLAVAPDRRRRGTGRALLSGFEAAAADRGAGTSFLDVAADNAAALALYQAAGYAESGRRPAYYQRRGKPAVDAILMLKPLT